MAYTVGHSSTVPEDTTVRLPVDRALTTTVLLLTYVSSKLPLYLHVTRSGCDHNARMRPETSPHEPVHPTSLADSNWVCRCALHLVTATAWFCSLPAQISDAVNVKNCMCCSCMCGPHST